MSVRTLKPRLCQGRLCIYELMAEDAAVNYWEVRTAPAVTALRSLTERCG